MGRKFGRQGRLFIHCTAVQKSDDRRDNLSGFSSLHRVMMTLRSQRCVLFHIGYFRRHGFFLPRNSGLVFHASGDAVMDDAFFFVWMNYDEDFGLSDLLQCYTHLLSEQCCDLARGIAWVSAYTRWRRHYTDTCGYWKRCNLCLAFVNHQIPTRPCMEDASVIYTLGHG